MGLQCPNLTVQIRITYKLSYAAVILCCRYVMLLLCNVGVMYAVVMFCYFTLLLFYPVIRLLSYSVVMLCCYYVILLLTNKGLKTVAHRREEQEWRQPRISTWHLCLGGHSMIQNTRIIEKLWGVKDIQINELALAYPNYEIGPWHPQSSEHLYICLACNEGKPMTYQLET